MRRGQVALYLVLVLVGICLLTVMNVAIYLSVSTRNRTTNAGDAAALAVARLQGELLNRIGRLNLDHLNAVLDGNSAKCAEILREQERICFLGPLEGIRIGNEWATRNGITTDDEEAQRLLKDHVDDIRLVYAQSFEQYPAPWEGAWNEYALALESAIGQDLRAAPDNIDFIDAAGGHVLLNAQFYNAVAGRNWCWFHFNAPGLAENYSSFRDWPALPKADDETRRRRSCNSEVYSLHLMRVQASAITLFGRDLIRRLTGRADSQMELSSLAGDVSQVWYCYDTTESGLWRTWWEIDPDGTWQFPACGKVKTEYDVRGCAACCRVTQTCLDLLSTTADERIVRWTAAAKPFGTQEDVDGIVGAVTSANAVVLPSFRDVRLVPWDAVGGRDTERPGLAMLEHVRDHLPPYIISGVSALDASCFYCRQLIDWEKPSLHTEARLWLRKNAKTCRRATSGGSGRGGTPHGH